MSQIFGALASLIFAASIIFAMAWSAIRAKKTPSPDQNDWVNLQWTIGQWLICLVMILIGLGATIYGVQGLLTDAQADGWRGRLFSLVALFAGIGFVKSFFQDYLCRIRYNSERLEHSALLRRISVPWPEVDEIRIGLNGPMVITSAGNIVISTLSRGYYGLLDTARNNGVKIQDSPFLKSNNGSVA